MSSRDVAGLIAAAGGSQRMGRHKALIEHPDGGSFLRNLVEVFRSAGLTPIFVTIPEPPHDAIVRAEVPLGVEALRNEMPNAGLSGSVFTAMQRLSGAGLVITPIDAPFANVRDVRRLADAIRRHAGAVVTYKGKRGHPVAFNRERLLRLGSIPGGPAGLLHLDDVVAVASDDRRVLANINTPEDLEKWGLGATDPRYKRLRGLTDES